MREKLFTLATMVAAVFWLTVLTACNDKEEVPYIKSDDAGKTITAEGAAWSGWSTIIQSNIELSYLQATSTADWCTVSLVSSGSDAYQLLVEAADNTTLNERQGTIAVQSTETQQAVRFIIKQQAGAPMLRFVTGGTDQTISSQATEWQWEMETNVKFSSLDVNSSEKWCKAELENTDNKLTLKVSVDENVNVDERKATIIIRDGSLVNSVRTSFTVTQQSAEPAITFTEGGTDQTISPDGKSWTWELTSNLSFKELEATSSADWCTVTLEDKNYQHGMRLSVKVAKNETVSERKAVVTVKSTKYDVSLSFNVTQQAGTPTISFTGTQGKDQNISAPEKVLDWTLQSNVPYSELKVTSNESWCQVKLADSNETKDVKSYSLTITIAENTTDKQREAVVTISSEKYNVSKSFKVTQSAATFSSSHASVGFDRDAGSRTVTIKSNASWKAECSADWVTLEQTDDYLTVRVNATTVDRQATITFKDKSSTTITVNQTKYKVGEAYSEGGVTGTVAYIGDDKRFIYKNTGKSTKYQQFFLSTGTTGSYDQDDGEVNMQFITRQSGWSGNFLAAAEVDKLNTGGVTGWYLPAINELRNMRKFVSSSAWSSTANNNGSFSAYALIYGSVYSNEDRQTNYGVYAIRKF